MNTIIRIKAFAPKITEDGIEPGAPKQVLTVPQNSTFLSCEPSSSGGFNIWLMAPTEKVGTDDAKDQEKRGYIACKTGVELPAELSDCLHLKSFSGIHIFEIPAHLAPAFAGAKTGLES